MSYALAIGLRYLRSKKRATVSVISIIAVTGVALGVAALLAVVSITSGFQQEFRDKVLGVNAHVLVLKYGLNFEEYRDVIARARKLPETAGAAPFIINEMMLAKGDKLSGVLIKGVDPVQMKSVLDLPSQLVAGSLEGLRRPDARPATRARDLEANVKEHEKEDLDSFLEGLAKDARDGGLELPEQAADASTAAAPAPPAAAQAPPADAGVDAAVVAAPLPAVKVPSLAEAEAALAALELGELPSDEREAELLQESEPETPAQAREALPGVVVGVTFA
jgi:lipoprotein-releasing system permease protein